MSRGPLMSGAGAILLLLALTQPGYAVPRSLDLRFGGDGKVTTDFTRAWDEARAVAVQPDGKIVAAGGARLYVFKKEKFALARYNTDGSLDTSFGKGGRVLIDFGRTSAVANAVAIQSDGKIVSAGNTGRGKFAVVRCNPDGSLDTAFGNNGKIRTDFTGQFDAAFAVAIQADGKIVTAGLAGQSFALARYQPDGSLDPTFGMGGILTTHFLASSGAQAVAIQTDGKIVAAGTRDGGNPKFALARYNTDGSLDSTFSADGMATTDFTKGRDGAGAVAIQANGKIVAAGGARLNRNPRFALARYNTDGSLDSTFSGNGRVTTDFAKDYDFAYGVAIQPDGAIVAAGQATGARTSFAAARYAPDGSLDLTFGSDGLVRTPVGTNSYGRAVAIQANGRIVVAGSSDGRFALVRYRPT